MQKETFSCQIFWSTKAINSFQTLKKFSITFFICTLLNDFCKKKKIVLIMGEYETAKATSQNELTFEEFRRQVMDDYRLAVISREVSLVGRKEVLRGKAKFGIFGDGKEIAQLALSKVFQNGDWRSGYYRDQTFAFATGMCTV